MALSSAFSSSSSGLSGSHSISCANEGDVVVGFRLNPDFVGLGHAAALSAAITSFELYGF